jgi:hypothetical protein
VFRRNVKHQQAALFSVTSLLPEKVSRRLAESWAGTFYQEVFCRIDEAIFEPIFSGNASRPNAPVNQLVGADILKSGFGWSDLELFDHLMFDLQVRHALGIRGWDSPVFELRTLYNFRKRVCAHAQQTGEDLFARVRAQVTDAQLKAVGIKVGWQRMDSTQLMSNVALLTRLELVISTLQKVYRLMSKPQREVFAEALAPYLGDRAQRICYRIAASQSRLHLERLGEVLSLMVQRLEGEALKLAKRLFEEQYEVGEEGAVIVRPAAAVPTSSLQSPHDEQAGYRRKGGHSYRGYVAAVSETCSPDNPVQLVTDVVVEANTTDDGTLLARSLAGQARRGIEVEEFTVDGGFTGPVAEAACKQHGVILRPTRIRGGRGKAGRLGWEAYHWQVNEEGEAVSVICPQGQQADLEAGKKDRLIAKFDPSLCSCCPFFKTRCRIVTTGRGMMRLYVTHRSIKVALLRQGLRDVDRSVRAVVEATVRELKHPLKSGKLPLKGLIRTAMYLAASAMMVNARRLHRFQQRRGQSGLQIRSNRPLFAAFDAIAVRLANLARHIEDIRKFALGQRLAWTGLVRAS